MCTLKSAASAKASELGATERELLELQRALKQRDWELEDAKATHASATRELRAQLDERADAIRKLESNLQQLYGLSC